MSEKGFMDTLQVDAKVKIRKTRKISRCQLINTFEMHILGPFPPCGKIISPKSTVFDITQWWPWGNSVRETIQIRYCGECAVKYGIEEGSGRGTI